MLDNDEGVSLLSQGRERFEQPKIIPRMQPDRRLVQHVEHTTQIGAKLRGQNDSLRFAAAQCLRRTAKREIT